MARVYVSSTFTDLQDHREAVRTAIRRMGHEDVAMEHYLAEDRRPLDRCLADVRACDLYVVVMAWRYGFVPEGMDRSVTDLEYREAVAAGKPVLAFVLSDDQPWQPRLMEATPRVAEFRAELLRRRVAGVFTSKDDLARRVTEALHAWDRPTTPLMDWDVYRQAVVERYRWVRLSVIAGAQDKRVAMIPLTDVFVPQQLYPGRPEFDVPWEDAATSRDAVRVLGESRRQVVLGGPGSGKSTLFHAAVLSLCDPAAREDAVPPALRSLPVPLLVELRQYVLDGSGDFVGYVEKNVADSLNVRLPPGTVDQLLRDGGAVVFFDGLDEILDPAVRARVVDRFRAFTGRYPDCWVVVSSRIVGYDDTELGLAGFDHHTLLDFGLREIGQFVPRWYEHYVVEGEDRDAAGLIRRITDNPRLLELAGNPLLLSMMAIIYKHHDLPEKRWQLYARCTGVLLEDWDVKRKRIDTRELLRLDFPVGADQKSEILEQVAVLMLNGDKSGELNAIGYEPLRDVVAGYLESQYARPAGEARALAVEILNHLRERTHVLAEIGDGVFGFVHRTFMEYFAARHVLTGFNRRRADYPWLLNEVYARRWNDDRWHEALLLLSGMLAGQGSPVREIVDSLQDSQRSRLFAAHCLAEAGQVPPDDRAWAAGVLAATAEVVRARVAKRRAAEKVEEAIAVFGQLAVFVRADQQTSRTIAKLLASDSTHHRVAGWQLDIALAPRATRRGMALNALERPDATVRRAAIAVLEREWPGDEVVFRALGERLRTEQNSKIREPLLAALDRNWPRRPEVLDVLRRHPAHTAPHSHLCWLAEHLATAWARDREARALVLGLAGGWNRRLPDKQQWAVVHAVRAALVAGWAGVDDTAQFLDDAFGREKDLSIRLAAATALLELDAAAGLRWLRTLDAGELTGIYPVVVDLFGSDRRVLDWAIGTAVEPDFPTEEATYTLASAALARPDVELVLRAYSRYHHKWLVRATATRTMALATTRRLLQHAQPAALRGANHVRRTGQWLEEVQRAIVGGYWQSRPDLVAAVTERLTLATEQADVTILQGLLPLVEETLVDWRGAASHTGLANAVVVARDLLGRRRSARPERARGGPTAAQRAGR
ncbi:NACHT domain-containing protein [Actinosynnema sp. NPDC053489]|uniref:NACHT domain-containing protein n=1 Tax=Actinosynnema sp. NPDC053489 TaxID=3363916 RepID=UPI0037C87E21